MGYKAQRFGFSLSRGWTLILLLTGGLLLAAYWIGPLRPLPAELQLVVPQGPEGAWSAQGVPTEEGTIRFAVPVAIRNTGAQEGRPQRLVLSVPARYHVTTREGRLRGEVTAGVPLRQYEIELSSAVVPADSVVYSLPSLDSIWLEPDLPSWYCVLEDAGIPAFVPAPTFDPSTISSIAIYYALRTPGPTDRHTSLINVRVDPNLLQVQPASMPPSFPTVMRSPEVAVPELGPLQAAGTRTSYCGDPDRPVELFTALWETTSGGRFFVVYVDGRPRKHLYDLNDDGMIELESWDADGDGSFEARREARIPVPEFLVPRPPRNAQLLMPDTVPPDTSFLRVFDARDTGWWRFGRVARTDSAAAVFERTASVADTTSLTPDSAWLALFNNASAGPFRFTRGVPAPPAPRDTTMRQATAPGTTGASDSAAAGAVNAPAPTTTDTVEPAPRPAPRPRRAQPLGTPVRIDTIPGGGAR